MKRIAYAILFLSLAAPTFTAGAATAVKSKTASSQSSSQSSSSSSAPATAKPAAAPPATDADKDMQARLEAAKAYEQANPVKDAIDEALDRFQKGGFMGISADDMKDVAANVKYDQAQDNVVRAMAGQFTLEEIKALTKFSAEPAGKSALKKFGNFGMSYNQQAQQAVMTAAQPAMQKMMKARQEQMQKDAEARKAAQSPAGDAAQAPPAPAPDAGAQDKGAQ